MRHSHRAGRRKLLRRIAETRQRVVTPGGETLVPLAVAPTLIDRTNVVPDAQEMRIAGTASDFDDRLVEPFGEMLDLPTAPRNRSEEHGIVCGVGNLTALRAL